jgi:hypothetical protein
MTAFFVGQRVRVNCPQSARHGEETHIEELFVHGRSVLCGNYIGHQVALRHRGSGTPLKFEPHELIPILPDGHRACDDDFKRDLDRLLERQGIAA